MRSFTIAEKASFFALAAIFVVSGLSLFWKVGDAFLVEIPNRGGTLVEGIVGNPRFINPVLAISEADRNLTALVYSGLVHISPEGNVENDLAEDISISEDRKTYTVRISPEAIFHDGDPVTAEDVVFTMEKILDPLIKSPRRANWEGVTVSQVDEMTVSFTLKQPYTPFINNLSIGILPKHIWKNVSNDEFSFSQFNTLPVGSGPYEVGRVERNSGGIPNYYRLSVFEDGLGQKPFIKNIVFRFYPSEETLIEAYNTGEVASVGGISSERIPELKSSGSRVASSPLPRVFAVFFNQSSSEVLKEKAVRRALDLAAPKEAIAQNVFNGFATPINGPVPAGLYPWASERENGILEERMEEARTLLANAGWTANSETGILEKKSGSDTITLSFSISTGDAPELRKVADELIASWRSLGADVQALYFETGDLNQNVIRPRNFDALLFGEVIGRDADLYPFWHSSQKSDPGLNVAMYSNTQADKFLEEARTASDPAKIEESLLAFAAQVTSDVPAVFLYTPGFVYVVPEEMQAMALGSLAVSQDRFLGIRDWYIETNEVWKIFADR